MIWISKTGNIAGERFWEFKKHPLPHKCLCVGIRDWEVYSEVFVEMFSYDF